MSRQLDDEGKRKVLEAVRDGAHPNIACIAAGMGSSYYHNLRYRARNGEAAAKVWLDEITAAAAEHEVNAAKATTRATKEFAAPEVRCPHCDESFKADPEALAAMVGKFESFQKAKGLAAEVAIKQLERRHPQRWSQKVIHTVQEEHERLLNVCQRVLAPEVFELLLEEYLAAGSGESETPGDQSGETSGGVH